jgi:uncharacterized protein (TIGR02186 family)
MIRRLSLALAALALTLMQPAGEARAERLITSVSASRVLITSSYTGAELVLFGAIERDAVSVSRAGPYDIVVTVKGPASPVTVREKQRLGPIWVNADQRKYVGVPGYLAIHSSRPLADVSSEPLRERFQLGLMESVAPRGGGMGDTHRKTFHEALIRIRANARLFQANDKGVVFLAPGLFRAAISLPATAPLGNYEAIVTLFSDGAPLATEKTDFEVVKTGFEAQVAMAAFTQPWLYGLFTILLALGFGWLANYAFRRD